MVKLPCVARADAVKVSVTVLTLDDGARGLADHTAVRPDGRLPAERAMFPVKVPPVTAVKLSVAEEP
jgi:hypothetical protein